MIDVEVPVLGKPSEVGSPRILGLMSRSRVLAVLWTAARIWLGVEWIQAGRAKLWGAENSAFMHHDGAGVAGFATHGAASYTWWHHFLTGFVVPNSGWIGILISVSEFVIGVALVLGVFTPGFAFAGLVLNVTYMLSGTAGVNPAYAAASVLLILMWRTSGWIGVDGIAMGIWQRRRGRSSIGVHSNGTRPVAEPTPPADPGRPVSPGSPIPAV
jgi:thiosulfate dehydrogenase [quinone] large subunit